MTNATNHITEREFQATVVALARAYGWMVNGVLEQREYSKRLSKGFPDLVLARYKPGSIVGWLIFAELKSQKGRVSPEQRAWLTLLSVCGQDTFVWRPGDLDEIERVLR